MGGTHLHALGHDDDAEILSFTATMMQVLDDRLELCRKLRDDDHVGAPGQAAHHRDPTGVATHHLDDHHPVVRGGRGMQAIECLDDDPDSSIETEEESA